QTSAIAFSAVAIKLVLIPAVMIYGAWLLGYGGTDLVVMFVLFASPTAVASFMMVEAMGGNSRLAANIVLLSTLGSVVTISAGIVVLKMMGIF
ncbi:MAG: AEC family transporter, partial [Calditrichaeota bacterium]|nr:AEC family transporter [Calditrichota bacterium]